MIITLFHIRSYYCVMNMIKKTLFQRVLNIGFIGSFKFFRGYDTDQEYDQLSAGVLYVVLRLCCLRCA